MCTLGSPSRHRAHGCTPFGVALTLPVTGVLDDDPQVICKLIVPQAAEVARGVRGGLDRNAPPERQPAGVVQPGSSTPGFALKRRG